MFPFDIHSDTIANRAFDMITPNNGSTFGWQRAFHVTNSLQNLCEVTVSTSTSTRELRLAAPPMTHASNLLQVTVGVYPQCLDRNLLSTIFAFPHVPKPATVQRDSCWTIG